MSTVSDKEHNVFKMLGQHFVAYCLLCLNLNCHKHRQITKVEVLNEWWHSFNEHVLLLYFYCNEEKNLWGESIWSIEYGSTVTYFCCWFPIVIMGVLVLINSKNRKNLQYKNVHRLLLRICSFVCVCVCVGVCGCVWPFFIF